MRSRGIGRPPRTLIVLIVATTLVPLMALLWLGWTLLAQDRHLEAQQARAGVERVSDLVIAALQRAMGASEQRLAAGATDWGDGAVALTFFPDRVDAAPRGRIPYLPAAAVLPHAAPDLFGRGEQLEFAGVDGVTATAAYRRLATSQDPQIRTGALFRVARSLRKSNPREAVAVYARLVDDDGVSEGGVPVGLAARYARCTLFEQHKRLEELHAEATRLASDLAVGRWPLDASVYAVYAVDVARWLPGGPNPDRGRLQLAEAAVVLWQDWRSAARRVQPARRIVVVRHEPLAVLWQDTAAAPRVLIATRRFVESEWLNAAVRVADEHGVAMSFRDASGTHVFEYAGRGAQAVFAKAGRAMTITRPAQADFPWTLAVTGDASPQVTAFATRRRLLVAGFVLLVFMALVASYLIVRAVGRELAVARLHSDFVATVSHEFRTPLTSLRQFTEMLRDRPSLDEERRRICYDAQARATERLSRLVESVLDLGRIEAGVRSYALEPRDCTAFVRDIVDDFRRQPEAAGHLVEFSGNSAVPVRIDGEAVSRAVWNLLDNAVKYSPAGRPVRAAVARRDAFATIAVRDEGMGLGPHERAAIFTKFRRGEQALKRGIKGTGIGLAIAHEVVKAHGGRIEVESERDAGSTFTIVLPAKE